MSELDDILHKYRVFRDSQAIVRECIAQESDLLTGTVFFSRTKKESTQALKKLGETIELLAVLDIVAYFESKLSQYIEDTIRPYEKAMLPPSGFARKLYQYIQDNAEKWRFDDKLELFKEEIDQHILSEAKKLYKFRNWIAHGQRTQKPSNYTPEEAKEAVEKFLQAFPLLSVSNTNDPLV